MLFINLISSLNAQEKDIKSVISGRVVDAITQQPLSDVSVHVEKTEFGIATDSEGNYTIENVPVGRYSITANMIGYNGFTKSDIVVVPRRTTIVNFELTADPIEISTIVVESEYFEENNDVGLTSVVDINRQEILKTPGAPDIFRRLQSLAGVIRASDQSPALIVRGGSPDENLTLLENIEVYSPFHFANLGGGMENGLSIVDPKLIENVRFSTGGFSVKYGDKLSSVNEIFLRDPEQRRIIGDAYVNMGGAGLFLSGPLSSKVSWMVSGRRGIWDLLMKIRGEEYYPRTIDLHSKVVYEPLIEHRLTFSGVYAQDEVEGVQEEEKEYVNVEENMRIVKDVGAFGLNWRWLYSENGFIKITPYLNLNNWSQESGPDEDKDKFGSRTKENYYGIKGELTYQLSKRSDFVIGGDFKAIKTDDTKWSGLDTLRTGVIVQPYRIQFGPEESFKASSFLQYSYTPFSWARLNAGLRYDYFDFTGESTISPRVGASFDVGSKVKINLAYGLYTQSPQFFEIFLSPLNADLKTSKAYHYILGVDYFFDFDLMFRVEGFYKDMKDLTVAATDTSKVYESTGLGDAMGIEFSLIKKMSEDLYLLLNYTHSQSRRKDISTPEEYDFDYDSPNVLNVMATYKLGDWWEFGLIYRYATGLPYTPYDLSTRRQVGNTWYCDEGLKNSERLPDYQRLDIRVDRRFVFSSWNLSVYLEIWNLTNHENVTRYEYSEDFLEKKPVKIFSLMPMLGVAMEF